VAVTGESDAERDEILGRTRCARCGHILDGEIECPFCAFFPDEHHVQRVSKWVFLTACFLTSPLSLPFLFLTQRLTPVEKTIAGSGMVLWAAIYRLM
jgi:hypothetical protein